MGPKSGFSSAFPIVTEVRARANQVARSLLPFFQVRQGLTQVAEVCPSPSTDCVTSTPSDFIDASTAKLTDDIGVLQLACPLAEPAHMVINLTNFVEWEFGARWSDFHLGIPRFPI